MRLCCKENIDDGNIGLGLSTVWRRTKDNPNLKRRIAALMTELRYAWQRAWRGYDDADVFDLGFRFVERMPILLQEYKRHNDCLLRDQEQGKDYTEEETERIIDEMIFYFQNCSETFTYQRIFGVSISEDDFSCDRCLAAAAEAQRCRVVALRLFSKWCFSLWI